MKYFLIWTLGFPILCSLNQWNLFYFYKFTGQPFPSQGACAVVSLINLVIWIWVGVELFKYHSKKR